MVSMPTLEPSLRSSHLSWLAPLAAGISWLSIAAVQFSGHDFRGHYDAPIDYVRESVLMIAFAATAASGLVMSRMQDGRGEWPARGTALAAAAAVTAIAIGMVGAEEPDWFFNVMGPALMLMMVSLLALAVRAWTTGVAPRWALVLVVLTPISIPAFWMGFSVLPALGWLGIARKVRLGNET